MVIMEAGGRVATIRRSPYGDGSSWGRRHQHLFYPNAVNEAPPFSTECGGGAVRHIMQV